MRVHLDVSDELRDAFRAAGVEPVEAGAPTVLSAPEGLGDWSAVLDALATVFTKSQQAAAAGVPVVYVVSSDALLGRSGPLDAMAATGIVSASRTLALELRKQGVPVNCVGRPPATSPATVVRWCLALLQGGPDDPTGELVQLGGAQIGKALS